MCSTSCLMKCSMGMAPAPLNVLPIRMVNIPAMPMATIMDNIPFVNITPFALCISLANPAVAAATAAALGVLVPMPCTPVPAGPWSPPSPKVMVKGIPTMGPDAMLQCAFGGTIQIITPGQFKVIAGS